MQPLTSDNPSLSDPTLAPNSASGEAAGALSERVLTYVRKSISDSTRRAYVSDLRQFEAWGGVVPCMPELIASYLADRAGHLSIATLCRRLAAISTAHEAKGLPNPIPTPLVRAALRGIRRVHGVPQHQAAPLLVEDLLRLMPLLGDSTKDVRDRALLLMGFAGGFRRSELVALRVDEVETVRQGLKVQISRAKTDQMGIGRQIGIPFARGRFCPVKSLETWLSKLPIADGLIFRALDRHGHIVADQLSTEAVSQIVKDRAAQIGLDPAGYSGHSLRAGLCTSAAAAGISTLAIRQQTGHRSDQMVARYVRAGELFTNNAAGALL